MPEADRFQGETTATLKAIQENIVLGREEFSAYRREDKGVRAKMFERLEGNGRAIASVSTQLDGHVADDHRRFRHVWQMIFWAGALLAATFGAFTAMSR